MKFDQFPLSSVFAELEASKVEKSYTFTYKIGNTNSKISTNTATDSLEPSMDKVQTEP